MSDRGGRALRSLLSVSSPAWEKCTQAPRAWSRFSPSVSACGAASFQENCPLQDWVGHEALSFYMPMHSVYPAVLASTVLLVRGCWPCRPYRSKLVSICHASGEIDILPSKKRNLVKNQSKISKVQGTPKLSLGCVTPINAFREGWNLVDIVFGGGPRSCQCQCMGALPEEPPVFASEGTLPWLCSWRWTESVPWAHCPKSYPPVLYLPVRAHCPGFALWRSGPSPCRGRTARRAVSILPMRAHCPGLLLAVDRVRAVGALPEELYQFCQWGRTALACSWRWTESVPVGALPEELLASAFNDDDLVVSEKPGDQTRLLQPRSSPNVGR